MSTLPALALIPARAGSKGVPGKNLRALGGKSLLAHAIDCAKATKLFDKIAVSSDGPEILAEARRCGAEAIERPAALSGDSAAVVDAIAHALETLAEAGYKPARVALLEPSCPLREPAMVERAMKALDRDEAAFTVSALESRFHPAKQFALDSEGRATAACPGLPPPVNRQSLGKTYIRNGAAYAFRTSSFETTRSVLGKAPRALVIEKELVNIDTLEDFARAEALWGRR